MLAVGLLFAPGAAQATTTAGKPVAWGCGGVGAWGQCSVPSGLSGVTAIAAGNYYSLALKSDGTVVPEAAACSASKGRATCQAIFPG